MANIPPDIPPPNPNALGDRLALPTAKELIEAAANGTIGRMYCSIYGDAVMLADHSAEQAEQARRFLATLDNARSSVLAGTAVAIGSWAGATPETVYGLSEAGKTADALVSSLAGARAGVEPITARTLRGGTPPGSRQGMTQEPVPPRRATPEPAPPKLPDPPAKPKPVRTFVAKKSPEAAARGAAAAEKGKSREQKVADITGGRVSREPIKTPYGSSDVDVIGPNGELIAVGGPSKAVDLGKLGSQLKVLKTAAEARGVIAQAFFEVGTPQSAIDLAIKKLGAGNVFTFGP